MSQDVVSELAPGGTLRAGINMANGLLVTGSTAAGEPTGTGLRWRAVQDPLLCRGEWQESFLDDCEELGTLLAAGLEAGVF
jgi:hypothetical protein